MHPRRLAVAALAIALAGSVGADDSRPRIVAVGDIHGDYDNFVQVLRDTGIVNERLRWSAGTTRLVQVGDIADRGPDTRRIIELLMTLEKQARRRKGAVHVLIGNHESMNMQGDLRYVHPGEYAAFVDRQSGGRRDRYFEATVEFVKSRQPEAQWPAFDAAYRTEFDQRFPLGYVEHQLAWAPGGEIGRWVLGHDAIVKVGDTLFVHGGLTAAYAHLSLSEINTRIRTELADPAALADDALVNVPDGPLWSRSAASNRETAENEQRIDQVLEAYDAARMVVGHTPLLGVVLPRFGGKVIVVDVGLSSHYGGSIAALEIDGDVLTAVHAGERTVLPADADGIDDYLGKVAVHAPDPSRVERYLERRRASAAAGDAPATDAQAGSETTGTTN